MKCYEGAILSVNAQNQVFRYLVEDRGRILYVGDTLPAEYAAAERVRLGQRAHLIFREGVAVAPYAPGNLPGHIVYLHRQSFQSSMWLYQLPKGLASASLT